MLGSDVRQFSSATGCRRSRDRDVRFLKGDLARPLGGVHRCLYPLAELGRSDKEQVLLLLTGDQDVVLVLPLLLGAITKRRHAVAVLPIVEPFTLVTEAVAALRYTEACPLVVLPLAQVGLGHRGVHLLVLQPECCP